MGRLFVTEFVTLNGVMEAPGGEPTHPFTGWVEPYFCDEVAAYKLRETLESELLLIGRVTYESFAGAWPTYEGEFADKMNSMPKAVVSSTLTDPEWANTTVLGGDLVESVTRLKAETSGAIQVAGSCQLVHALLDADLVDELHLMVFPVTIGAGLRVFPDTLRKATWHQIDSRPFPSGARIDTYESR
jgi:dihydrofolate reductase